MQSLQTLPYCRLYKCARNRKSENKKALVCFNFFKQTIAVYDSRRCQGNSTAVLFESIHILVSWNVNFDLALPLNKLVVLSSQVCR